jgi:hypothetical protein
MSTTEDRKRRGYVGMLIRDFPLPLKRKIAAFAEAESSNFQDITVAALAAAYGVKFVPTGRRTAGMTDSTSVNLEMPRILRRKINEQAARIERPSRSIVLQLLTERFGGKKK